MKYRFGFCLLFLMLVGCAGIETEEKTKTSQLTKVSYADLPGWEKDNLHQAFLAFLKSCEKLIKADTSKPFRPAGTYGDFRIPCQKARALDVRSPHVLHHFFETWFNPYRITEKETGKLSGLFTGYYEASLNGSLRRYGPYQFPLYAMPDDLVTADLGQWYEELEGKKITAQIKDGKIRRYPARSEIEKYGLDQADVIVWVDDPVDSFFLQIQGSGVVKLDNGRAMRVGYAGKNGHSYYAIGRALIDRGELRKEEVSLQSIRKWMKDHPGQAQDLMNLNPSYVFFRKLETDGPVGAQGAVLTPARSLAFDRTLYDYGMPVWLSVAHPQESKGQIAQLMVAQDTGGAIRGVVRGDFFWGYGPMAEQHAGQMKSSGSYWFLLPKTISVK